MDVDTDASFDEIVVGGGLQAGLLALAFAARRPGARVAIIERGPGLGGNHLWSFHDGDVAPAMLAQLAPLIAARWPAYDVAFPGLTRTIHRGYASMPSERLEPAVRATGASVLTGTAVRELGPRAVVLDDGRVLRGGRVIDARGPGAYRPAGEVGWQKFVGLELKLRAPAELPRPVVMDATVAQRDGFRFLYSLPLASDRILVEDTWFSDSPDLEVASIQDELLAYAAARYAVGGVVRVEQGALPLPLDAAAAGPEIPRADAVVCAGYRGGWFHPTTGYSVPLAARFAWAAAAGDEGAELRALAAETQRHTRFARLLNRLLFRATPPAERWRVLERFHRLPETTVSRFYNLAFTRGDRLRILCGRPPRGVSLRAALRAPGGFAS